jgi:hypothetical protein
MLFAISVALVGIFAGSAYAGKPAAQKEPEERTVFVTGSLIPQRIKLKRIGTTTISPIRIIDRREIDQTGRHTTQEALTVDPSVRTVGH